MALSTMVISKVASKLSGHSPPMPLTLPMERLPVSFSPMSPTESSVTLPVAARQVAPARLQTRFASPGGEAEREQDEAQQDRDRQAHWRLSRRMRALVQPEGRWFPNGQPAVGQKR